MAVARGARMQIGKLALGCAALTIVGAGGLLLLQVRAETTAQSHAAAAVVAAPVPPRSYSPAPSLAVTQPAPADKPVGADGAADAPMGDRPRSPAEQWEWMRDQLVETGASGEAWTRDAAGVFAHHQPARATFAAPVCYRGGCIARADYDDMNAFEAVNEAFPQSAGFVTWQGPKYRSPPEVLADGRVRADWVLFRPEGPPPSINPQPTRM